MAAPADSANAPPARRHRVAGSAGGDGAQRVGTRCSSRVRDAAPTRRQCVHPRVEDSCSVLGGTALLVEADGARRGHHGAQLAQAQLRPPAGPTSTSFHVASVTTGKSSSAMAMMARRGGCWPRTWRAFCSSIAWRTAGIPPRTSCSRWELLGPQCASAALRCAVDTAGRRSRRPASRSSRPRPEPSRSGRAAARSPGDPRHRSGVSGAATRPGRPATRRSAPSRRLAELRVVSARRAGPSLPRERSSPRPDGRRSRRRLLPGASVTETSGVDLTVPTTSIRCASASSVLGAFGGDADDLDASMPTSISARTTHPRRRRRGRAMRQRHLCWRAPAPSR